MVACNAYMGEWFLGTFVLVIGQGQTGFPWIDAIMVQLKKEGWIHHLARHAVACFLTRGDLWISWEEGMKVNTSENILLMLEKDVRFLLFNSGRLFIVC